MREWELMYYYGREWEYFYLLPLEREYGHRNGIEKVIPAHL